MRAFATLFSLLLVVAACSSDTAEDAVVTDDEVTETTEAVADDEVTETTEAATDDAADDEAEGAETTDAEAAEPDDSASSGETATFTIEVWADNWMAVYVNGELIGEDSVPITTERSFNSETFTFDAAYPFTLAIEARDFKETDSGLEYIGENNQQMGDGGIIAQVLDDSGAVVAVTDASWTSLVVHRAPLNTACESDPDPDTTCEYEIIETPADWAAVDFDDSGWSAATQWSAEEVDPKMGYDDITWAVEAQLIWGTDLEIDNTVLLRTLVTGG